MKQLLSLGVLALAGVMPAPFAVAEYPHAATRESREDKVLATRLVTVADDFVVEVYRNGERVGDDHRELLEEVFGATVEQLDLHVREGDWLVFHVVNNHLRWNGTKYFAVTGLGNGGDHAIVSDPASPNWFCCDDASNAKDFIENREAGTAHKAQEVKNPWQDGDALMLKHAGEGAPAKPLWGQANSTWIKYVAGEVHTHKDKAAKVRPVMPAAPKPAMPTLSPTRWQVQIISATYGTGGKNADVTAAVKELVERKKKMFTVSPPDLGADPNPYWNKALKVVYIKDGVRREQHRNENEWVLPESFYGPQDASELTGWLPGTRWVGKGGELQFQADHSITGAGLGEAPTWEATGPASLRITWSANHKAEHHFDYTWGSFHEVKDEAAVYHQLH